MIRLAQQKNVNYGAIESALLVFAQALGLRAPESLTLLPCRPQLTPPAPCPNKQCIEAATKPCTAAPLIPGPAISFPHRLLPWPLRYEAMEENYAALEAWQAENPTLKTGWVIFQYGRYIAQGATRESAYENAARNSNFDLSEDRYCTALSHQRSISMCPSGRIYEHLVATIPAAGPAPACPQFKHVLSPLIWTEVCAPNNDDAPPNPIAEVRMKIDTGAEVCGCTQEVREYVNPPLECKMLVQTLSAEDGGPLPKTYRNVYSVSIKLIGDLKPSGATHSKIVNVEMIEFGMNLLGCNVLRHYDMYIRKGMFVDFWEPPASSPVGRSGPTTPLPGVEAPDQP